MFPNWIYSISKMIPVTNVPYLLTILPQTSVSLSVGGDLALSRRKIQLGCDKNCKNTKKSFVLFYYFGQSQGIVLKCVFVLFSENNCKNKIMFCFILLVWLVTRNSAKFNICSLLQLLYMKETNNNMIFIKRENLFCKSFNFS